MTLSDWLLVAIAALLAGRLVQAWIYQRELTRWLDGLGDMAGDLLRGILEAIREEARKE